MSLNPKGFHTYRDYVNLPQHIKDYIAVRVINNVLITEPRQKGLVLVFGFNQLYGAIKEDIFIDIRRPVPTLDIPMTYEQVLGLFTVLQINPKAAGEYLKRIR